MVEVGVGVGVDWMEVVESCLSGLGVLDDFGWAGAERMGVVKRVRERRERRVVMCVLGVCRTNVDERVRVCRSN